MPDDAPATSEPQQERPPVTAAGKLRPHPSGDPPTTWSPEGSAEPVPERRAEVGTLEQRADRRRREGLRREMGIPALQATGWALLLLGGLLYLHALWATANEVLDGSRSAEQLVVIGGLEILQGTLGLAVAFVGLLVGVLFTFLPVRYETPLVPGTLEFEVAAENLVRSRDLRRILIWVGVLVFLVGLALAGTALKESIAQGELYTWSLGGNGYRIHLWGYALVAVGVALALPLALSQGAVERAAALAEGVLGSGRVRRVTDATGAEPIDEADGPPAPEERLRPPSTPPDESPEQPTPIGDEDVRHRRPY